MKTNGKKNALVMCECAIMIALAAVLSFVKILELPYGGSVTAFSIVPIVIISYRHGVKWGLLSGFVFSIIQLIQTASTLSYATLILGSRNNHFLGLYIRIHGYRSCRLSQKQGQQSVCRCRNRHGRSLCFKIYLSCNFGLYRMGRCFNPVNRRTSLFTQLQRYIYDSRNNNQCGGCILAFRLS